jgi:ATP-dependent Clp protease ATP-binding subunit ClpC
MKKTFRPEFINRIDEIIVFQHLTRDEILQIADLYMKRVNEQAKEMGISIMLSEKVKDMLVDKGYDPNLGARPLRRAVQRFIEDPLSEELLLSRFSEGDSVLADVDDEGNIIFKRNEGLPEPAKAESKVVPN